MSQTTRTDAFYTGPCKLPQTHRQREFAKRLEADLEECRAVMESVHGYLEQGPCLCDYSYSSGNICGRCRLLDEVKTSLANTAPAP